MARKTRRSLLKGDLEQISSKVFDTYHDEITELIGRSHGVYALYLQGRLYYVGLAKNLRRRVKQHLRDKHAKKWDAFSLYLIENVNYLKELESLIVHIAEPQGNVSRGRFANSESLIDRLRDKMEERDKRNRELILSGDRQERPRRSSVDRHRRLKNKKYRGKGKPKLKGLLPANTILRVTYKGNVRKAKVDAEGHIVIDGRIFDSPSLAGNFVRGGKSTNGWTFWRTKFQTATG